MHVLASLAVAAAPTVELVTVGRVFQGIGAAGSGVVAMAIVRDLFSGQRLIRMLSRLALVWGLAPVLAPVIGSQLLRVFEWRGVFVVLAGYGLVMVIVSAFFMIETLPPERRGIFSGRAVARRYRHLARDGAFVGAAILGSMVFTALFSYLSSSSFLLQDVFGMTAQQYGIAFGVNSEGHNHKGFAGMVAARYWSRLDHPGGHPLGTVLSQQTPQYTFHAMVCHTLRLGGFAQTPTIITQCLDAIDVPDTEEIACVMVGGGPLGQAVGADTDAILQGIARSRKRVAVYSL